MKRVILILLLFFIGCVGSAETQTKEIPSNARLLELEIEGMTCPSCAATIQAYLTNTHGILRAEISQKNNSGTIIYDPSIISEEEILNLEIFSGPYKARVLKNSEYI
jgi:copper chaperone CopZ